MSTRYIIGGQRSTRFAAPADTTTTTIYTQSNMMIATLLGLNICAISGGASASVWIYDGTTNWPLLETKAISANTSELYDFGNPVLRDGWLIKVKDHTGAKLTFTLVISEEAFPLVPADNSMTGLGKFGVTG